MKKISLLFSLMLLIAIQANAQWTALNAPKAHKENYTDMVVSDNGKNLYAIGTVFFL